MREFCQQYEWKKERSHEDLDEAQQKLKIVVPATDAPGLAEPEDRQGSTTG